MKGKHTTRLIAGAVGAAGLVALLSAPTVMAATQAPMEGTLVALGDSITFGYNLPDTAGNTTPSVEAFPDWMAKQYHLSVTNLGVPGWTSKDLLLNLQQPDISSSIQHASLITLDIGSNDLLHFAARYNLLQDASTVATTYGLQLTPSEMQSGMQLVDQFKENLQATLAAIRKESQAPIILYTLYNPFPSGSPLHQVTNQFQGMMDDIIRQEAASFPKVVVAHAHSAFAGHQLEYVDLYLHDVHPTLQGQEVLAQVGESALAKAHLNPLSIPVTSSVSADAQMKPSGNVITGQLGALKYTVSASAGAVSSKSEVLFVSLPPSQVQGMIPAGDRVVTSFSLNFSANTSLKAPLSVQLQFPSLQTGDELVQKTPGGWQSVQTASFQPGSVKFSVSTPGEYVVLSPVIQTVSATKPVTGVPVLPEAAMALAFLGFGAGVLRIARRR
ncbi:SGNH/GDSL hydrolase family protein [Alicyclobacillus sp. TC]|uniref:SGNH/GDSL hydrolase family protein n=1 Tax=Alicyclobacillus sp. TC TaxID=2606450 RepID=UPI001EE3DFFF|nr:SGNH/GDSL hydrolase family protein [Alicyclobacillus sp. TC]